MTTDFNGRTMLSTKRMLFSGISTAVVPLGMAAFLKALGDKQSSSYTISMGCFIALFAVCVFIAYKSTWELTPEEAGFDEAAIETQKKEPFDFERGAFRVLQYERTCRRRNIWPLQWAASLIIGRECAKEEQWPRSHGSRFSPSWSGETT